MYLLDTNLISELRKAKSGKADVNVIAWARSQSSSSLFVSAISILEIEMGILLKERTDPKQAAILRTWLNTHVLTTFADRILPIDTSVALKCAKLHIPNPKSERDALIAATALVHGMTVITRNTKDLKPPTTHLNRVVECGAKYVQTHWSGFNQSVASPLKCLRSHRMVGLRT